MDGINTQFVAGFAAGALLTALALVGGRFLSSDTKPTRTTKLRSFLTRYKAGLRPMYPSEHRLLLDVIEREASSASVNDLPVRMVSHSYHKELEYYAAKIGLDCSPWVTYYVGALLPELEAMAVLTYLRWYYGKGFYIRTVNIGESPQVFVDNWASICEAQHIREIDLPSPYPVGDMLKHINSNDF